MKSSLLLGCLANGLGVYGLPTVNSPMVSPIVDLGYSTYQGMRLAAGVDQYLGMRYAAPPLGDLRFRAPQPPMNTPTVQDATSFGALCVGVSQPANASLGEDCLFINVWSPSNATVNSKLPVWLYIQGGGYADNSNPNYNGTDVLVHSGQDIVFVNFNYRVGALGFLASEKVRWNGDLNAGLLDQRLAMRWVQQYINLFGGDPEHVVIHGASAGAGSVALHLAAYGGVDEGLFVGAIAESTFWPTQRSVAEMEFQFDEFVMDAGCANASDAMSCLRSTNISIIQSKCNVAKPFPGGSDSPLPLWYFLPVTDGELIPGQLYTAFEEGRIVRVPLLVGDDTDDGTMFAYNASTAAQVSQFIRNNYPYLTAYQLEMINMAYPPINPPPFPLHAEYFYTAEAAYGEVTFICPGNEMAHSMATYYSPTKVWNYRYNVQDPVLLAEGLGVPHTSETDAIFGYGYAADAPDPSTFAPGAPNAAIVPVVMDYWISFIKTLNPSTMKNPSAPAWMPWGTGIGQRLKIQTNATGMETVPMAQWERCEMWKAFAPATET
ncbi:hypothetical protein N7486_003564 [Penicillium sp. IBT 16267x]|nr:hypothetical protein N7486_003564 [Penicillium sp. IBT 16267x]